MEFKLTGKETAIFWLEEGCFGGVRKIAEKVCRDVALVTGNAPKMRDMTEYPVKEEQRDDRDFDLCEVIIGTLGKSEVPERFCDEKMLSRIRGKRECFLFQLSEKADVPQLLIVGSDKRGTIYGLFHLSEYLGVSPWVRFADVTPKRKEVFLLTESDNYVSKEPSVKYRGFFINDEWPAFGNWTFSHYGGFTSEMYDMIFETLLRLKGNYLWPAMWTSSFTLDGPGEANAVLADEYGIVMSNSHHEPCLRHSEEWDLVRGENSPYGNEWDYVTNKEGLLRYWRDGLKRSGKYENIITIGMRGERDSIMLGPDATLEENISLLKEIIARQRELIVECVGEDEPQMIALYKEVEAYFYGHEGEKDGLKDWDGLDGVTLMLCEDNFGNMRTLPMAELKDREGGWGMYYHFDYHGGPVSYEWVNSSYLPKVWDQMSMAYEFGIRDIWIVNVGDVKFQEYPLSFFMDLAYDYEKWGISNLTAPQEYLTYWVNREFGAYLEQAVCAKIETVMKGYTRLNHNRKPEAMSPDVYHPVHYDETEKILTQIAALERMLEELSDEIPEVLYPAFFELVCYPAMGSLNVQKMNLYAGINQYFAGLGAALANDFADRVKACMEADRTLTGKLNTLLDGKWQPMGASEHIGFRYWNEEECRYPVRMYVEPANKERMIAFVKGDGSVTTAGGDWTGRELTMKQFLRPDVNTGEIVLLNAGNKPARYTVVCENPGFSFSCTQGTVSMREDLAVVVDRKQLKGEPVFIVHYEGGNIPGNIRCRLVLADERNGGADIEEGLADFGADKFPAMTFLETDGIVSIEAAHYADKEDTSAGAFTELPEYGKTLSGMKVLPCDRSFSLDNGPKLLYRIFVKEAGDYRVMLYTAPANPMTPWDRMEFGFCVNEEAMHRIPLIPEGYVSGDPDCPAWCEMVLNQIRITSVPAVLHKGYNELYLQALKPGFLLEKIVVVRSGKELPDSYLGPEESFCLPENWNEPEYT